MDHDPARGAVDEPDRSSNNCTELEQSSHESSLLDVEDLPKTQVQDVLNKNRRKDTGEIRELIYELPPDAHPELDNIVTVSSDNAIRFQLPPQGQIHVVDPPSASGSYHEHPVSRSPSQDPTQTEAPRPPFRVRFRSRVRIASGMHHHNHRSPYSAQPRRNSSGSVDSESSPCSSISAPLRYAPDDANSRPSYTSSIQMLLKSKRQRPRPRRPLAGVVPPLPPPRTSPRPKNNNNTSGERASLLRAPSTRLGARTRRLYGDLNPDEEDNASLLRRSRPSPVREDVDVFGSWPWRLFNGYWWAWKCGTISGCCCPTDGDDDESEDEQEQRGGR